MPHQCRETRRVALGHQIRLCSLLSPHMLENRKWMPQGWGCFLCAAFFLFSFSVNQAAKANQIPVKGMKAATNLYHRPKDADWLVPGWVCDARKCSVFLFSGTLSCLLDVQEFVAYPDIRTFFTLSGSVLLGYSFDSPKKRELQSRTP